MRTWVVHTVSGSLMLVVLRACEKFLQEWYNIIVMAGGANI
jgi:hypothetical protein